jgi:hypothetical protein
MAVLPTNRTEGDPNHVSDHNELNDGHNLSETHRNAAAPHTGHETPAGAQAKVDTHAADTTSVHGIADTADLMTVTTADVRYINESDHTLATHQSLGLATDADLDAHIADGDGAHVAGAISFVPTGNIASTNVQAAIAEVALEAGSGGTIAASSVTVTPTGGLAADDVQEALNAHQLHVERTDNPHAVTKAQVGLGNVNNTSDADKPISTATQTALDTKVPLAHPLRPTAALYENFPRITGGPSSNTTLLNSGRMHMVAIWLPANTTITSITFVTGGTGVTTPSNQWFALYDSARALLRQTVDDTTTAWAANTAKTLNLTSTFTTTYTGLHHIGITVVATGMPTILCGSGFSAAPIMGLSPVISGSSNGALTSTAPNPANAISAQGVVPYCYVS